MNLLVRVGFVVYNPEVRRRSYLKARERALQYSREYNLNRKFGIGFIEYQKLLEKQKGICAICKEPPKTRMLAVDHCHDTGQIRGLLCSKCNRGIGYLNDDPERLKQAIKYISGKGGVCGV